MIAVVVLAWAPAGLQPFRRLLASYAAHDAGIEHELVVVMKEFTRDGDADAHRRLLDGVAHREVRWPQATQDLPAYVGVAHDLRNELVCGLNTHSEILARDWLGKLAAHAARAEVGVAGASGTWESHVTGAREGPADDDPLRAVKGRIGGLLARRSYPAFPNPHVRTNAFVLRRALLLELAPARLADKEAVHRFESGRRSLTRGVLASGLRAVVVGRDGAAYPPERWPQSATFRAGGQRNLLVADNRTRQYGAADGVERARLRRLAWGDYDDAGGDSKTSSSVA